MRAFFIALAACLVAAAAADDGFVINSFDAAIDIGKDGYVQVQEKIAVTFTESKRGIFRLVPVDYDTGTMTRRPIFRFGAVTDEHGNRLETKVSRDGPYMRIRIGDPDVFLDPGTRKTYVINYRMFGVINWFEDSTDWKAQAEFYWNVTGDEWPVTIERSSFRVTFPQAVDANECRMRVFVGPLGSRLQTSIRGGEPPIFGEETETRISLTASEAAGTRGTPLAPNEGMTVVLGIPAGLIERPTLSQRFQMFVLPNLGFGIPLAMLAVLGVAWFKFGKDPYGGPMVVQYDPPDDISGPVAGAMVDERVDNRDVAASIFALATKGYITMHADDNTGWFGKRTTTIKLTQKAAQSDLTRIEDRVLGLLQSAGPEIDEKALRTEIAPHVGSIREDIYADVVSRGYYVSSPNTARIMWFVIGAALAVGLGFLCYLASPFKNPMPAMVGGGIGIGISGLISLGMPKRTLKGAKAHKQVMGFEEFIRRARGQELDWMAKKKPEMALFEKYLPHAIAFGLAREWADAFKGVLTEAPGWYYTNRPGFTFTDFGRDVGHVTDDISYSAATPPRSSGASGGSSGFGGGGFSGGGFGGGGGGSW
jgi:uncharacterized membrane protein YgcG